MPTKKSSNLFALLCLIGTVWTVVATSQYGGSFYGTYNVKSDCVTPAYMNTVSVSNSAITSPSGVNFTTLGFPTNTLVVGQNNLGTSGSVTRVCETTINNNGINDSFLYTCSDNGQFVCNIYFQTPQ